MEHLFIKTAELLKSGKAFALCTIISTRGSTPLKIGAKMIVESDCSIHGTIGGGKLEKGIIGEALNILKSDKPVLLNCNLSNDYGMSCGGHVDIYIEPVIGNKKLYIFGAGHVGKAVARIARYLDFNITVADNRPDIFSGWDVPNCTLLNSPFDETLSGAEFDSNTFIVVTTYEHATDRQILAHCIKKSFAYLGMIASRNKAEITRKMFTENKVATQSELAKVDMPIGLDIHAHTAEEIAVSIIAKIITEKNKVQQQQ